MFGPTTEIKEKEAERLLFFEKSKKMKKTVDINK